jgi:hypothetical protein
MPYLTPLFRGACACLLGTALFAQAQTQAPTSAPTQAQGDTLVEPVAAQKQAREIAQGDPARWYREDTTSQAKMRTLHKELGAALQEAKNACKRVPAAERSSCLQEAQAVYRRDMAQAKAAAAGQTPE